MSSVMPVVAWPSRSLTTFGWMPAWSASVAQVWRRSCNRICLTPARRAAEPKARVKRSGCSGPPNSSQNTRSASVPSVAGGDALLELPRTVRRAVPRPSRDRARRCGATGRSSAATTPARCHDGQRPVDLTRPASRSTSAQRSPSTSPRRIPVVASSRYAARCDRPALTRGTCACRRRPTSPTPGAAAPVASPARPRCVAPARIAPHRQASDAARCGRCGPSSARARRRSGDRLRAATRRAPRRRAGRSAWSRTCAEPIGHSAEPDPVVAQRRGADLGRDRHEPAVDPLAERLGIGCHVAAVVERADQLGHRVFGSSLGAEPAFGVLAPTPGRGIAADVDDVGPGLASPVHVTSHGGDVSNPLAFGCKRGLYGLDAGHCWTLERIISAGQSRCPERESNPHAPCGAGGFKPPASTVPPPGPGAARVGGRRIWSPPMRRVDRSAARPERHDIAHRLQDTVVEPA